MEFSSDKQVKIDAALKLIAEVVTPDRKAIRHALIEVASFVPEGGWNMQTRNTGGMYTKGDESTPLLSETCTYNLCGKDQGRTLLSLMRRLITACGFDREDIEGEVGRIYGEHEETRQQHEDRSRRAAAAQRKAKGR